MDDLYAVGPHKPLGYLPLDTILEVEREDIDAVKTRCESLGLLTHQGDLEETNVVGGALFAYDEESLSELLEVNRGLLEHYSWPVTPLEFIKKLGEGLINSTEHPALFKLIAWAYNDHRPEYQRPDGESDTVSRQPKVPFAI